MSEINEIARQQVTLQKTVVTPSSVLDERRSVLYPVAAGVWNLYDNPAWWGSVRPMGLEVWCSPIGVGYIEFQLCPTAMRDSGVFFRLEVTEVSDAPAVVLESAMRTEQHINGVPTLVNRAIYDPLWSRTNIPSQAMHADGYSHGTGQLAFNWTSRAQHGVVKPGFGVVANAASIATGTEYDVFGIQRVYGMQAILTYGVMGGAVFTRDVSLLPGAFRFRFGVYQEDGPDAGSPLSYLGSVATDHHLELFQPPSVVYQDQATLLANSYGRMLGDGDLVSGISSIWRWTVRYSREHQGRIPEKNVLLWPGRVVQYEALPSLQRSAPDDARSPDQTAAVWHLPVLGLPAGDDLLTDRESHHHLSAGIPAISGVSSHTPDSDTERSSLEVTIETSDIDWWSRYGMFAAYDGLSGHGEPIGRSHLSVEVKHEPDGDAEQSLPPPNSVLTHYVFSDYPLRESERTYALPPPQGQGETDPAWIVVLTRVGESETPGHWGSVATYAPKILLPGGLVYTLDERQVEVAFVWDRELMDYVELQQLTSNSASLGFPIIHHLDRDTHVLQNTNNGTQLAPGGFYLSLGQDHFQGKTPLRIGQGNSNYRIRTSQFNSSCVLTEHIVNWVRTGSVITLNNILLPTSYEVIDAVITPTLDDVAQLVADEVNKWYTGQKTTEAFSLSVPYVFDYNWGTSNFTAINLSNLKENRANGRLHYEKLPTGEQYISGWSHDPEPYSQEWPIEFSLADIEAGPYTHNSWVEELRTESAQLVFQIVPNSFRSYGETTRVDTSRTATPLSFFPVAEFEWASSGQEAYHDEDLSGQLDLRVSGGTPQKGMCVTTPERIAIRGLIRVTAVSKATDFKKTGIGIAIGTKHVVTPRYVYDQNMVGSLVEFQLTTRSLVAWPIAPGDDEGYIPGSVSDQFDSVELVSWNQTNQSQVAGQEGEVRKHTKTIPISCLLSADESEKLRNGEEVSLPLRTVMLGFNPSKPTPNEDYCGAGRLGESGSPLTSLGVGGFLGAQDWVGQTLPPTPLLDQFSNSTIKFRLV